MTAVIRIFWWFIGVPNDAYATGQNKEIPSPVLWELIDIQFYIITNGYDLITKKY